MERNQHPEPGSAQGWEGIEMKKPAIVIGFSLLAIMAAAQPGESGRASIPPPDAKRLTPPAVGLDRDYGKMPACFIPNRGQFDERVAYYLGGKGKSLYFTPDGVTMELTKPGSGGRILKKPPRAGERRMVGPQADKEQAARWVVKLEFAGAEKGVRPRAEEETGAVVSYFRGRPDEWRTGIPTYSRIVYRGIWPGIDLVYHGTLDRLKYEFIVQPGADPSRIRLAYLGVDKIRVDAEGRLDVSTPAGSFQDDVPAAYQESGGKRTPVALSYKLIASGRNETSYGFSVGEYDPSLPLVLDPAILVYCGFIGGDYQDAAYGIAVDASGGAYVTGRTASSAATFPLFVGPDLTKYSGFDSDAFVAKINSSGTALIYCGYIGGNSDDYGAGIAVDAAGRAYVAGSTSSTVASFPVMVGPGLTYGGSKDAWVARVNASGTGLDYCGYVGGSDYDVGSGIAVDASGNVYITGLTWSDEATFPVTQGPDLTYNGAQDAFVAKVNSSGSGLVYCGYIGGTAEDSGGDIAVDGAGNAYICGQTTSIETTFPVVVGPDLTQNGRGYDAFVAKINAAGSSLVYCGYIGGSADDSGSGIAVDQSGNAFVAGMTASSEATFPVKIGPELVYCGGTSDAFAAKVNAVGTALVYCGYIGGDSADSGGGIAVDAWGNAFIAGSTTSSELTFPVGGGTDPSYNGGGDAFVARIDESGSTLACCGYIGGSADDYASDIAVDSSGNAYVAGGARSTQATFPVTAGPYLTKGDSGEYDDAFVARIYPCVDRLPRHAIGDFEGDGADEAAFDFGRDGAWLWNGGVWTQILVSEPNLMIAADIDGNNTNEIIGALGAAGLWVWKSGTWNQLSALNPEGLAAGDIDSDGADEVVGDFGSAGVWVWNGGPWTQLTCSDARSLTIANLGGGGAAVVASFGTTGLWAWAGGAWSQLNGGVAASYVASGKLISPASGDIAANFGPIGLWLWSGGSWLQLSGVGPGYATAADVDKDGADELFADFRSVGLWKWKSGVWSQLSGEHAEYMIAADTDGDGARELVIDFGGLGLWLWKSGVWNQLSASFPRNVLAGDFDADGADEVIADFVGQGVWIWDGGIWSQISARNLK
jgi:hypothetical protein